MILPVMMVVVAMIVVAVIIMVMIMITMVVTISVIMAMREGTAFAGSIGAGLRLEGRLLLQDSAAETADHFFQYVILRQAQGTGGENLNRLMAIADMPGEARQGRGIACGHVHHRFVGSPHLDPAALIQLQAVAIREMRGLR